VSQSECLRCLFPSDANGFARVSATVWCPVLWLTEMSKYFRGNNTSWGNAKAVVDDKIIRVALERAFFVTSLEFRSREIQCPKRSRVWRLSHYHYTWNKQRRNKYWVQQILGICSITMYFLPITLTPDKLTLPREKMVAELEAAAQSSLHNLEIQEKNIVAR